MTHLQLRKEAIKREIELTGVVQSQGRRVTCPRKEKETYREEKKEQGLKNFDDKIRLRTRRIESSYYPAVGRTFADWRRAQKKAQPRPSKRRKKVRCLRRKTTSRDRLRLEGENSEIDFDRGMGPHIRRPQPQKARLE